MIKSRLLLALSFTILAVSCAKDPENTPAEENKLLGGSWKRTAHLLTFRQPNGTDTTQDTFAHSTICVRDNTLEFDSLLTGTQNLGGNKCSGGEADETRFSWSLTDNSTKLGLYNVFETFGRTNINATLKEFTASKMVLLYKTYDTLQNGQPDTLGHEDTFSK